MNQVKLYSNGTAVISREYAFEGTELKRIAIPVRKSDLDDVISSISIFGDVLVTDPPTYTPTNAEETTLTIDATKAFKEIGTKMAGSRVEIVSGTTYRGVLVGVQPYSRELDGSVTRLCKLVILTDKGVQQIEENAVGALRFLDPLIQVEFEKALRASASKVKPDGSVVEFSLTPKQAKSTALVAYATPVAAWKIRYQLRLEAGKAMLEGQGVVDNDTDDDWIDTQITVVNGEPITFSTDVAEIRRPERSRVNLVPDHAFGAVVAASIAPELDHIELSAAPKLMRAMAARYEPPLAELKPAQIRETGDFCMFTSEQPVTIRASDRRLSRCFETPSDRQSRCSIIRKRTIRSVRSARSASKTKAAIRLAGAFARSSSTATFRASAYSNRPKNLKKPS